MGRMNEFSVWIKEVKQKFCSKTEQDPESVLGINLEKDLIKDFISGVSVRECVNLLVSDYEYAKYCKKNNHC